MLFVTGVQTTLARRYRLTARDIADSKKEHSVTVEPPREARRRIFTLERQISGLAHSAYGLTAEEVALLWATAPPRMPVTPIGLATDDASTYGEDDDNGA